MNSNVKSTFLVSLQFILIGLLFWTTTAYTFSFLSGIFILVAIVLVAWAIISMQKSKVRISPIPANDAVLIITGPYKYIRHPMYLAVLLSTVGLLLIHFSWLRVCMAVTLAIVLIIKLNWEEQMLKVKFSDYKNYVNHSWRIIPFIY